MPQEQLVYEGGPTSPAPKTPGVEKRVRGSDVEFPNLSHPHWTGVICCLQDTPTVYRALQNPPPLMLGAHFHHLLKFYLRQHPSLDSCLDVLV